MITTAAPAPAGLPYERYRAMLASPKVFITAMICGTIVVLAALGTVGVLAYKGRGTEAILLAITTLVLPALGALWGKVETVRQQTNGTTSRVLDINERLTTGQQQPTPPADSS